MKTNSKKIVISLAISLIGCFAQAQGLQGIVVEKYYQTNAADAANALAQSAVTTLNPGSTVYRVYVDMAAGYKFSQIFGTAANPLKVTTTTDFYNDPNSGSTTNPSAISTTNVRKNTALIDSWFTTGGVASGKVGVLKSEDTDGSPGNQQGILANNPGGVFGLPINIGTTTSVSAADGMISGTVVAPNVLGITAGQLNLFDQVAGNIFSANNGAIAALGGIVGPTSSNMVLIGQFTTDGVFGFELNVQLVNIATGLPENYVSSNPTGTDLTNATLILAPNNPPTVSITAPSNGANIITGSSVSITANSSDIDGTVSQVEFLVDGVSVGIDVTSPYTATYTAVTGTHTITAKSTDNDGDFTISSLVTISVNPNQAPVVSISATPNTGVIAGDVVALGSTATDADGTVSQVEFFVDNVSIGIDNTSPYNMNWTSTSGTHLFKATATDNLGLSNTSSTLSVLVAVNNPPTASITSPLSTASFISPAVVTIDAAATDSDGTISQVEFFVNNVSIGTDLTSPYSLNWNSVIGIASITVKSTDNRGAITTSSILSLTIADPFALPYEVKTTSQTCNLPTFCMPIAVAVASPINDVIGFDLVVDFDQTKITPTGNITIANNLISSALVETVNSIDLANGKMNIAVSFKSSAPANSRFAGVGDILCVEFAKTINFLSVDTSTVSVSFLQESYISGVATKSVKSGDAITYTDQNYPVSLRFWSDNSPIKYDVAFPNAFLNTKVFGANPTTLVNNPNLISVSPSLTGNLTYNLLNGLGINIDRDVDNSTAVQPIVNAADATMVKDLLLNNPISPSVYQVISLDVNMDGVISAGDYSQIKQRAVDNISEFQQAWNYTNGGVSNGQASKDWIFVDSVRIQTDPAYQISATFPANDNLGYSKAKVPVTPFVLPVTVLDYLNCPVITGETFKGIMLGDADGSYAAYVADGQLKSKGDKVIFDLTKARKNGNSLDVPLSIISSTPVRALDFAIKFDQSKLIYDTVISNSSDIDGLSFYNLGKQTLRYTANDMTNFDMNQELVSIRFDISEGEIEAKDFNSTLGLLNGLPVEVVFEGLSSLELESFNELNNVSVYPNPTAGIINVISKENSTVELFDVTGTQVLFQTSLFANEKQEINLGELSNGIYLLKVSNNNFNTIKRVVVGK